MGNAENCKRWRERNPEAAKKARKEWKKRNREKMRKQSERYRDKTAYAPRHGLPWTAQEEQILLSWTGTNTELSGTIGRSVDAIVYHRRQLKKEMGAQ